MLIFVSIFVGMVTRRIPQISIKYGIKQNGNSIFKNGVIKQNKITILNHNIIIPATNRFALIFNDISVPFSVFFIVPIIIGRNEFL